MPDVVGFDTPLTRLKHACEEKLLVKDRLIGELTGAVSIASEKVGRVKGVNEMLDAILLPIGEGNRILRLVRGGNLLAHIVAMLAQKAGVADAVAGAPPLQADDVAFIVGHDTQLGALGGLLDAHWNPGHGIAADDMPPGGALLFELYSAAGGEPRVRLKFATQTQAQFRSAVALPDGVVAVPVRFAGCTTDDCSVSLASLAAIARDASSRGFVLKEWTQDTNAALSFPPLVAPAWTGCTS